MNDTKKWLNTCERPPGDSYDKQVEAALTRCFNLLQAQILAFDARRDPQRQVAIGNALSLDDQDELDDLAGEA